MKPLLLLLPLTVSPLSAQTFYSEEDSGPLSNFPESPTDLGSLSFGTNLIMGTINEGAQSFAQPDSFRFAVPEGQQLTSLSFLLSSDGPSHFLGLLDASIDFFEGGNYFFATLITGSQNGSNILPLESDGGSFANDPFVMATGYDLPLPAGDYALWFQETQTDSEGRTLPIDYTFDLTTQPVPEPSLTALLGLGGLALLARRR